MLGIEPRHVALLRIVDDQYHLGFYQHGVWVDLGRAVIRMAEYEEDTQVRTR